jgi:hypothetical protein
MTAGRAQNNLMPPWLWFWIATFFVSLPYYVAVWRRNLIDLVTPLPVGADDSIGNMFAFRILGFVGLSEFIPSVAVVLGMSALSGFHAATRNHCIFRGSSSWY